MLNGPTNQGVAGLKATRPGCPGGSALITIYEYESPSTVGLDFRSIRHFTHGRASAVAHEFG